MPDSYPCSFAPPLTSQPPSPISIYWIFSLHKPVLRWLSLKLYKSQTSFDFSHLMRTVLSRSFLYVVMPRTHRRLSSTQSVALRLTRGATLSLLTVRTPQSYNFTSNGSVHHGVRTSLLTDRYTTELGPHF